MLVLKSDFNIQDHLWYDQDFNIVDKADNNCIYPALIDTMDFDNWTVPSSLDVTKIKVVFIQTHECGFASKSGQELEWLSNLASKYKIELIFITSDHLIQFKFDKLLQQGKIKDNFKVKAFTYFKNTLWFHDYNKKIDEVFIASLESNKKKKEFHFLSFNRATKKHRICIFGELMTNPHFKNKFITL